MATKLSIDREELAASFPGKPFRIRHHLAASELFQLPRLVELSKRLPASQVEYNAGNVPVSLDPTKTPRTGLSVEDTIKRIEECSSWMALKNVESDPEYKALLDACLDEVDALAGSLAPGMCKREGFIFISSPGSVTPYHIDPEHNFLLQIRGLKTMHLFDYHDRSLISEEDLERFHTGGHRNLRFDEGFQEKATSFHLAPGDGVHSPVNAPHWVKNGPEVSISFSITFRSAVSERFARLHRMNGSLRRLGLTPRGVGEVPWLDASKDLAYRVVRKARHVTGLSRPVPACSSMSASTDRKTM